MSHIVQDELERHPGCQAGGANAIEQKRAAAKIAGQADQPVVAQALCGQKLGLDLRWGRLKLPGRAQERFHQTFAQVLFAHQKGPIEGLTATRKGRDLDGRKVGIVKAIKALQDAPLDPVNLYNITWRGADNQIKYEVLPKELTGIEAPIVYSDVPSAEMIKLASNAFLATRISFINEIANVCELTGADVEQVAEGMGLDRRIGPHFLHAGIGYGGSCFPKDVTALKQLAGNSGYHFQLLSSVIEVNELQKRRVVGKLEKYLGTLAGKTIAILGLTFKPETNDMREAASIVLGSRLLAEGAEVRAWDPLAERDSYLRGARICDSVLEAVTGADAAVIVTEWKQLRELASDEVRLAMRNPLIIDGRNLLDPAQVRAAGFAYDCVGRPGSCAPVPAVTADPDLEPAPE